MSKGIVRLHIIRYLHYFGKWLTDRFSKVYNPLNKLVRRIKERMGTTITIMVGMAFFVVSFNLFLASENKVDSPWFIIAVILFVLSCWCWKEAYTRAKKEDEGRDGQIQTQEKLMQTLVIELKGFREDIRNRGKRIKARPKKGSKGKGEN